MSGTFMTRSIRSLTMVAMLITPALLHAAAIPTGGPASNAEVRKQLSSYFANIQENSPTVLGGLAKSPEVMAAIQKKIAGLNDQELAHYRKLMTMTPDWRVAPEAISKAFPSEVMNQVRKVGKDFAAEIPEGNQMRDDVRTLVAVLKLMPDEKLTELGLNREMVAALNATFTEMTPLQAAMLHRQATTARPWDSLSAAAMKTLPPALQRGAAALAEHGPLTDKEIAQLGEFRSNLMGLLDRIDKLPPETRASLNTDALRTQMQQISQAAPDVMFMIRHNVPDEMVESLTDNIAFMERIANISDAEKKDLEQFRSDFASAFSPLAQAQAEGAPPAEGTKSFDEMIAGLQPAELSILKQGLSRFGNWQTAMPVLYQAAVSPDVRDRMVALEGPAADVNALASLEAFRQQTLMELASMQAVDTGLLERATKGLQTAPAQNLELVRSALASLPAGSSASDRLSVVSLGYPPPVTLNCGTIDFPSPVPDLSLAFLCNPIASAFTTIRNAVLDAVDAVVAGVQTALNTTINGIKTALEAAVSAVTNAVNGIINGIEDLANDIWNFIKTVPDLAWEAIQFALNALLEIEIKDGVTVRDLVGRGVQHALTSMRTLLGLAGDWWTAISSFTLPLIPCPPAGFHTPFGDVGDGAASDNYGRYRLVIDGIIEMIPDTEVSLFIKIPAQILYMAFDFLGLCLEQAAANADNALAAERHSIVITNFANLSTYIGTQVGGLTVTQGNQTTQILNLVNTQSLNVRSRVTNESLSIQALLNAENDVIQNLVNTESTEIRNLIQAESDATQTDIKVFKDLALRLTIEKTLRAGNNHEIAHLQLLEPLGHLRLVSDIVRDAINATKATNQPIGNAESDYAKGAEAMNAGREKEAFRLFTKAYQQAASRTGSGTD